MTEISEQTAEQRPKRGNPNWRKGVSANPGGRPKKEVSITALVREKLDPERFADAVLELAYSRDLPAIREVWRRVDGEVTQPYEHSGPDGGPISIEDARQRLVSRINRLSSRNGSDEASSVDNGA